MLTAPVDIIPGHVATITSQSIPHKPDGSLITVSPNLGVILTADAAPNIQGHQIAVSGGVITFDIQAPLGSAATIIDNAGVGFSTVGGWTPFAGQGYQNSVAYSDAGAGADVATWSFSNLIPGEMYQVSATWSAQSNRATDAPYTISGVLGGPVLVAVNQELVPNDFNDQSVAWKNLALVTVTGSTLTVQLSDLANEYVIADAIRIQRVGGPLGNLEIEAVDVEGEARGTTVFPITQPADDLFFDLNSGSNATQPGYIGLNDFNNGFNSTLGYGWANLAPTFDRGLANPTELLRDGHYGSADNTFRIQLDPGATYQVTLRFRDTFARDGIQVFVEGELIPEVDIPFLSANTTVFFTFTVDPIRLSDDGVLDLRFHDTWISGGGGDPFWIINAIEIDRIAPIPRPLSSGPESASLQSDDSLVTVTGAALQIWSGTLDQPASSYDSLADLSADYYSLGYDSGMDGLGRATWAINAAPAARPDFVVDLLDTVLSHDPPTEHRDEVLLAVLDEMSHLPGQNSDDESDDSSLLNDPLLHGGPKAPGPRPASQALIDHVLTRWSR